MSRDLYPKPLTADGFAPFGDLIDASGPADMRINQDRCGRYHDRAELDFAGGRAGISLFKAEARRFPILLDMVERHPLGSQAFIPMTQAPFLVIVARDVASKPSQPEVFITAPGQGVNYHKGTWHGVLTPLTEPGLFSVVDRIGEEKNLEEHWFDVPYSIHPPQ